jgi:hypothetical protein
VVRSLGMGGVCGSPRSGRFRIDRSGKGLGGGINNAEPQIKKVRSGGRLDDRQSHGCGINGHIPQTFRAGRLEDLRLLGE